MRRPIDPERLRAAYQAGGFKSVNALADGAGVVHTTLSRVLSGRIKKVNPATLTRVARSLRVPEDWLTGERRDLPFVPEVRGPPPGAKGSGTKLATLWERPTTDYLRYSWFMQRGEAAVRRDLDEWFGDKADAAYRSWGGALLSVFGVLASSLVWRMEVHSTSRGGWDLAGSEDVITITWLEHILGPWLAGEAYLDAEFIRELYQALVANSRSLWSDEIRDADALRALASYAAREEEVTSERLAAEYTPDWDDDEAFPTAKSTERARKRAGRRQVRRRTGRPKS